MPESRKMKEPSRAELDVLMAHLLRSSEVLQQASGYLRVDDFDPVAMQGHQILYSIVLDFYKEHRCLPSCEVIYALVDTRIIDTNSTNLQSLLELANSVKRLAYACFTSPADKDLIPSYAFNIMESQVNYSRIIVPGVQAANEHAFGDMFATLLAVSKETVLSRSSIINPFGDVDMLGVSPRENTGVVFLDKMLNGGVRPKEIFGLIGPSGGGKTTLVNQIGLAYAAKKKHFVIFQYEESPASNEFMASVYACAAEIPREKIESSTQLSDFDPDQRRRYEQAKVNISNHLHFVDMSGTVVKGAGNGGVGEIDSLLHSFKNKGIQLNGIAIDWFLPMARRCYANALKQIGRGGQLDERAHYSNLIDELKQVVGQHNLWCLVASQTAAAEAQKKKSEWNNAAETKAMAWFMNGFFTLGALDSDNIAEFNLSKGRRQKKTKIFVKMMGEVAKFVSLDEDMKYDPRQGKHVVKGQEHVIPTDKPSQPEVKSKKMANIEGGLNYA